MDCSGNTEKIFHFPANHVRCRLKKTRSLGILKHFYAVLVNEQLQCNFFWVELQKIPKIQKILSKEAEEGHRRGTEYSLFVQSSLYSGVEEP